MGKEYCVYVHQLFDGRMYFGATCQKPSRRWRKGEGYSGTNFHQAIQEYGWDSFNHVVLEEHLTEKEAHYIERFLIKKYKTQHIENGFNVCGGGKGWTNPTDDQKKRFSDWSKKANTGRKHTDEYKAKMSERMKENNPNKNGRCMTEDRIKQFAGYARKPKPESQRKKMSQSSKKRKIQCVETGEVFNSMKEAAELLGLCYTSITCAVYDSHRRAGGYHWKTYEGL